VAPGHTIVLGAVKNEDEIPTGILNIGNVKVIIGH
jgi:hypothetical protein